jgi:hypothetical protein
MTRRARRGMFEFPVELRFGNDSGRCVMQVCRSNQKRGLSPFFRYFHVSLTGFLKRFDFMFEPRSHTIFFHLDVVSGLQVQPEPV